MNIPDGWIERRLGELCFIEIGGTPSRSNPSYWDLDRSTKNAWVSIKDLRQRIVNSTAEQISDTGVIHSNAKLQPAGTILLSFKLTIGRVAIAGIPLYTNEAIAGLRSYQIAHDYLFYGLQQWDLLKGVDQAIKGATLNKEKLKRITCYFPKSPLEQSKVAEILAAVERAVEQTEELIAKQQRIRNGLMKDLLTRGIDEYGNLRSEETHEFKDSPLGRIPIDWEIERCAAVCIEIVVGIVVRPAEYYRDDGIPVLRSANVKENRIDPSNLVYMSNRDNEILSKSKLRQGDLVTVRTGYPGTTSVIPTEFDGCNCVDIVISRPNPKKIRSHFLSIWVNSDYGKRQVLEGQGGLAQQHFNVGEMRALLVKVPRLDEQKRIEELLLTNAEIVDNTSSDAEKLRSLKTGLMQDLLSGRVRVTQLIGEEAKHDR